MKFVNYLLRSVVLLSVACVVWYTLLSSVIPSPTTTQQPPVVDMSTAHLMSSQSTP